MSGPLSNAGALKGASPRAVCHNAPGHDAARRDIRRVLAKSFRVSIPFRTAHDPRPVEAFGVTPRKLYRGGE